MTNNFKPSPEIQKLIETGIVSLTPIDVSVSFDAYITQHYPWMPVTQDTLDWERIEGALQIYIEVLSSSELIEFVHKTRLGRHEMVAICISARKPCFRCSLETAMRNLDTFTISTMCSYFFGVDVGSDGVSYAFDDFVEVDYDERMVMSGIAI
jgi:hypothetical protein